MATENRQEADLPASNKQEGMVEAASLTYDELVALRSKRVEAPPPPKEDAEIEQEQTGDDAAESDGEAESGEQGGMPEADEPEESEDDVLSQLDSMSEEELSALGSKIRSKVPKRFAELTKRAKQAEERLAQVEAKLAEKEAAKNPLQRDEPVVNNPFSDINTIDALAEQNSQFVKISEWAEDLLDEYAEASLDEVITKQDGKELTKREVREYKKKAKQAVEKFLPARLQELQRVEQGRLIEKAMLEKAKTELEWFANDEDETRKEFELVVNDPRIKAIRDKVPEVAPQLDYLLAHAVNSLAQTLKKQKAPAKKSAPTKPTPPSNPSEGIARGTERTERGSKEVKERMSRFEQSRDYDDFIALRAMQRLQK